MAYNVFLSFAMEDKPLVDLFRGQAESRSSDLEFHDYSLKEKFDFAWKSNCERVIRGCSATICLVGKDTHQSNAVDWEIRKSAELGKGIMAMYLQEGMAVIPQALRELRIDPLPWQIEAIMDGLRQVVG